MSTIKDVANLAGISVGTVSNYLTGAKSVLPDTAKKIKDAIEELNYKPNQFARNLRTNSNREIGVILPNTAEHYYAYLLEGIESEIRKAGYYLNLALTEDIPENEISVVNNMLKKNVSGLIVMSCLKNTEFYDRISGSPLLFIDRKVTSVESNFVSFNQYETMQYLLNQLFDHGYEKIALVAGPDHFSCEYEYTLAYYDFFKDRNIEVDPNLICHISMTKEEAFRTGISLFQDYSPQAVISTSRLVTNGLEQAAFLAGISLYDDMVMVSIGEETLSSILKYNNIIVTMRPANYLGVKAARLLLSNVNSPLMFEKQQIILKDKIIGKNLFEASKAPVTTRKPVDKKLRALFLDSPNAHGIIRTHADFTRKTGIDVEVTLCEHGTLLSKLLDKEYISDFDVIMYDNPWLDVLVSQNLLTDITYHIESNAVDQTVFLDGLLEKVGMANERYYGTPFLFGPQLLLYRRDLFEDDKLCELFEKKYGAKLRVPRTWFEFNVISSFFTRSITSTSPVDYGTSFSARNDAIFLPELLIRIWAYNATVFDDKGNPLVTSPSFKKGVNSLVEAFKFTPPETLNYTVEDTVKDFYLGKTAMLVGFASFIADVNNTTKSSVIGKVGYANVPGNRSVLGSWGLAIPASNADPSAALEFIEWTCDSDMSKYFTILDGQSPLKNVYTNDELANHYPWLPLIYKSYQGNLQRKSLKRMDGTLVPITQIESLIFKYIMLILKNSVSIDNAMFELRKELCHICSLIDV